jgi:HD-GYP domain-containing protein (c-di-GMP phosphodiesterase class II)
MDRRFGRRSGDGAPTGSAGSAQAVEEVKETVRLEAQSGPRPALAEEVLERLARAGRFRDEETAEHVERMSRSCALIACELGWPVAECNALHTASAMHDIGKVGVPDAVLRNPGELTAEERALIEAHTEIGHDILSGSDDTVLQLAATVALAHHERFDGGGYPRGLEGEAIPFAGRIAAVADVFDALVHDRVYRPAVPMPDAIDRIRAGAGTQFDPEVTAAFEAVLPQIEAVLALYPDPESAAAPQAPTRVLTAREREIVHLLASGLSGVEVGERLFLSSETVRTHIRNAMRRLDVKTRTHLVARAITSGEIPSSPPRADD